MKKVSNALNRQSGAALIMVLLISAVLGVLVTMTAYKSRILVKQGSLLKGSLNAQMKVNDVEAELVFKLTTSSIWLLGPTASRVEAVELPKDLNFHGQPFEYRGVTVEMQDMSGLLSIVPFDEDSFKRFLRQSGIDEEEANIASDSIQDWLDSDDFKRLNGAESSDYNTEGFPRNGVIPSLKELREVQGVDKRIYEIFSPWSSLFGVGGTIARFAPDEVLQSVKPEKTVDSLEKLREEQSSSTDEGLYPSRRLRISLSLSEEQGGFSKSFVLVRGMGTRAPFFYSEYKFGK